MVFTLENIIFETKQKTMHNIQHSNANLCVCTVSDITPKKTLILKRIGDNTLSITTKVYTTLPFLTI